MSPQYKAIWKCGTVRSMAAVHRYECAPVGKSTRPEITPASGRCYGKVRGNLHGWGVISQDWESNSHALMCAAQGGRIKELTQSGQPIPGNDLEERMIVADLLPTNAEREFANGDFKHSPHVIFPVHLDNGCSHLKIAFVPLDENGNRFDVRPAMLRRLNDFLGAEGLIPGRGSIEFRRKPVSEPEPGGEHANDVATVRAGRLSAKDKSVADLYRALKKESLESLQDSGRVVFSTTRANGVPLSHPTLTFDGTSHRVSTLRKYDHVAAADLIDAACELDARRWDLRREVRANGPQRLEALGRLTYDRFDASGRWHRDPALIYDSLRMGEKSLRRDGFNDLADLIRPREIRYKYKEWEPSHRAKKKDAALPAIVAPISAVKDKSKPKKIAPSPSATKTDAAGLAAVSKATTIASAAKMASEFVTDPAEGVKHFVVKAAEHAGEKVLAGAVGSTPAGLIVAGTKALRNGDASALVVPVATTVLTTAVPAAAPILTVVNAVKQATDLIQPPTPQQEDEEDDLETMTKADCSPVFADHSRHVPATETPASRARLKALMRRFKTSLDDEPGDDEIDHSPDPVRPKI